MVYRLYVVWGRRWPVLVFPAILLICDILLGYSLPWLPMVPTPDFFATSVFTNVLCTVLILWRVLQLTFGPHSSPVIQRVIEGIVQSAAVYSAASIALVIMVLKSPDVGYVVCLNVFPALIGLVFSFIVVRTGLKSRDDDASNDSRTMQSQRMTTSTSPPSTIHHEQSPWHTPFVNDPTVPGDRLVAHPGATGTESIVPGQYNVGSPAFPFYMAVAPNAEQS
ncbi:hypothetical protein BD311DRAFT_756476 [Dichomitus squalens]|uniref:Transmembrane protein n=1 Tax=Dichomitus squalens TaxID=114155 RepID=A0A4Q9MTD0_9APHY|nr:hypothetical protein BD311DRAFT_756476 [Dichomitus squalens]